MAFYLDPAFRPQSTKGASLTNLEAAAVDKFIGLAFDSYYTHLARALDIPSTIGEFLFSPYNSLSTFPEASSTPLFHYQICLNGREWLSRQMDREQLHYQRHDNCFTRIEDYQRAQQLL